MALDKPPVPRTTEEVLAAFDKWKEEKTALMKFLLVKDCGLPSKADLSFETRGGKKVNGVRISHLGVISHFIITPTSIDLVSQESLNEDNVSALEEKIHQERKQILTDYFSEHPEDIPE